MHRLCVIIAFASLATTGCGKKSDDEGKAGTKATPAKTPPKASAAPAKTTTTPAKTAATKPEPSKPPAKKWLSPADLDPSKPIPVGVLAAAMSKWKSGTAVTVAGYAKFFIGEEAALGTSVNLVAEPGRKGGHDKLVNCMLTASSTQKVTNKSPLVFKASVDRTWGAKGKEHIVLNECTLVSHDKPFDAKAPATPGSDKPIPVGTFWADYFGFRGKEVAVTGKYWGQTVSSHKGKTLSIRIDIKGKSGKKVAGCFLNGKISEAQQNAVNAKRDGIVFKGKLGASRFGVPAINDCVIANR